MFLGPPGTGKTHLSIALGIRACLAGHRVVFATATEWVDRLGTAHVAGRLHDELRRLARLVHHAEVISLKGDSYRLKDRDVGRIPHDDAP